VASLQKSLERKLQIIDRALYDGSDVKDFGRRAQKFTAEIIFFGPNYLNEFSQFSAKCNEGTAGKLILPDVPNAILATFASMSIKSSAQDGETLTVEAMWYEATAKAVNPIPFAILTAADQQTSQVNEIGTRSQNAIQDAFSSIQNNTFVQALLNAPTTIRQTTNVLTSFINYPTTLKNAVFLKIGQLEASLTMAEGLINKITGFFAGSSTGSASNQSTSATSAVVDPVTGQAVADFSSNDTLTSITNPIATPSQIPSITVPTPNVDGPATAQSSLKTLAATLLSQATDLQTDTDGRANDVLSSIIALNNILTELIAVVQPAAVTAYLVPVEMSLVEVLFYNGKTADQIDTVHSNNSDLDDLLVIPAGTVVYL
jgi:prophage DNA circulation protein